MGFGSINLIVIDTDGSYSDHDVFKITAEGRAALGNTLAEKSFEEISRHPSLREHGFRLSLSGLPATCQTCPVVDACGGGSVMHRWHPERGLDAATIYCAELFAVLETATQLLKQSLVQKSTDVRQIVATTAGPLFIAECARWRADTQARAKDIAATRGIERSPHDSSAALILSERFEVVRKLEYRANGETSRWLGTINVQPADPRLVAPFLDTVRLLPRTSEQFQQGLSVLEQTGPFLAQFHIALPDAFATLISDVLFVESIVEPIGEIFSFSDDAAPNVLYISPSAGPVPLGPDDLGDSLLHEFLHQVLYHMERDEPMLHDHVHPRFPAPWRPGLRPAGGFFHGTFVFSGLSQYWAALARSGLPGVRVDKAMENAARFSQQAQYGIKSLRQFGLLTRRGEALLDELATALCMTPGRLQSR